jgi:hypothetical protein
MKATLRLQLTQAVKISFTLTLAWVALLLSPASAFAQVSIPVGTALPVRLSSSLSSRKCKPGQVITARLMQDVPLDHGKKLHAGSKVLGHILEVTAANGSASAKLSLRFDTLMVSGRSIPITTSLRALASLLEVDEAEIPKYGSDRGTPSSAYQTTLIGGEIVYRGGGHVVAGDEVVGEPVYGGVLSRLRANSERSCRGALEGNDKPQAMWLFSSDACGVYGYPRVSILSAGRTNPLGLITLTADSGVLNIRSGSGALLRVLRPAAKSADAS